MTIKEEVSHYLATVVDRLEEIKNDELRVKASLGVAQVLLDVLEELRQTREQGE